MFMYFMSRFSVNTGVNVLGMARHVVCWIGFFFFVDHFEGVGVLEPISKSGLVA